MIKLAAFALTAVALVWIRHVGGSADAGTSVTALGLGFVLLAAWTVGDLVRRLHVPRVTGYLLFGLALGPYLGNMVTEAMASQLQIVTRVATTLIALMAGLMLNGSRLSDRSSSVIRLTAITVATTMCGIGLVAWLVWPWLPIAPDAAGLTRVAMVAMLAIVASTFSPTMTAAVTAETGARGRLSELVLAMVVLADLALVLAFSLALALAREGVGVEDASGRLLLVRLAWEVGGAIAFGVFAGAVFALYMRYVAREIAVALLALCALLAHVGTIQDFQPLLAALTAGIVIENLAVSQGDALRNAIQRGATPALLIFFVSVGTSLRPDLLVSGGVTAVLLVGLRLLLLRLGVRIGVAFAGGGEAAHGRAAWTGLVSQAGITLGFAATLAGEFPEWGGRIQMLLVATMAVNELLGPLLFRQGLSRAGELHAKDAAPLIVVSNREPYMHRHGPTGITAVPATGGVAIALDALMRRRGGVWIAHGAGDADREVSGPSGRVSVPPESPTYQLRRLWIDELTFSAYYGGFANEGLWPLCHQVDVRPAFRPLEWLAYRQVNDQFAAAISDEMPTAQTSIFIQDYHLALVAPALRALQPAARTAQFWHIPWPHPDRLRICPWHRELIDGLLANDLLAFQLERDRRNFLQAVEELTDADVEPDSARVITGDRETMVVSVPIGVDFDRIHSLAIGDAAVREQRRLTELFDLTGRIVGLGVDRLDYTKGIPERLAALDRVLTEHPGLSDRLTFVQIGVPSRSELRDYAAVEHDIGRRIDELNARHSGASRHPVVRYHRAPLGLHSLVALYQLADFCVVSSLHDGMNLVAKEFVASREDEDGVLVLSSLAGAAQELTEALIINPYDVEGFAAALSSALAMPREERRRRMRAMRQVVAGRDVFLWASDILEGLESLWTMPLHHSAREWRELAV